MILDAFIVSFPEYSMLGKNLGDFACFDCGLPKLSACFVEIICIILPALSAGFGENLCNFAGFDCGGF